MVKSHISNRTSGVSALQAIFIGGHL